MRLKMNKIYNTIYYINLIAYYLLCIDYLLIFNYQSYSIPLFIIITILYLFFIKNYSKLHTKEDILVLIIYILFLIFIFIYGVIIQSKLNDAFIILYNNQLLLIPHLLFMLYNINIKEKKNGTK